jgi:DNA helicase II / ATP-dependent DNA helicase PcrA
MTERDKMLAGLNEEQKEAVCQESGPLLIIAGAGTGKTTVITRRIAWLIAQKLAKPSEILALTFTDKAADEMETRVDLLVPYGYIDVTISTFHAFGDRILRDHALDLGLRPDYRVLSKADQQIFFREHIFEFPLKHYKSLGDPTKHVEALIGVISRARDEDVGPEEYLAWARKQGARGKEQGEVAKVYKKYQALKLKHGFIDFGDQVNMVLALFRKKPSLLKEYQQRFKYILVDEFQDTNYAQFELLKLLAGLPAGQAGKKPNLTVVGDDDQSIYKFRGAAISNILGFAKTYPKCRQVVLTRNYRSTQLILDTAHRLIRHNDPERLEVKTGIDKRLVAENGEAGRRVEHRHFDLLSAEADWVAQLIKTKVEQKEYQLKDFAILVRSNAAAEPFRQALNVLQLPHQFSGGGGLYSFPEVRLVISFLKVIGDLTDSAALYTLALSEIYQLAPLELQKINTFAGRRNLTLHHVFTHLAEFTVLDDIKQESRDAIRQIMADIAYYLDFAKRKSTGEVLYQFLKKSGYLAKLTGTQTVENERSLRNIARFFEQVREFKEIAREDRVAEFVQYLNLLKEAGDDPESAQPDLDADAVNVLTVHKAKGLEFPVVFLVSLVNDKFPVRARQQPIELPLDLVKEDVPAGDFHLMEERRLFYVGLTRAKKELYLTSAVDYGGKRDRKVSQFVLEALALPRADLTLLKRPAINQIELFAPAEPVATDERRWTKDDILPLSHYQIDDYLTCPLKYKYVHLLKVPLLPNHQIIYGSALHKAVQAYFTAKKAQRKISAKELIETFANSWSSEGFISRQHEEQRFQAGRAALKRFFLADKKRQRTPLGIEQEFTILEDKVQIKGRIDLVESGKMGKGKEAGIYIVDFKSAEIGDQEKADRRVKESLQLDIYAMAWQRMFGKLPAAVELYFLDSGLVGSAQPAEKDLTKAWGKIKQAADGIRASDYHATPNARACGYCAYNEICPSAAV